MKLININYLCYNSDLNELIKLQKENFIFRYDEDVINCVS
jgi:hypothetical protein